MKGLAFLFPGQGSQSVGMGKALYDTEEESRHQFDEAEALLGFPLKTLCFEGPIETLTDTRHAQPALFVVGFSAAESLRRRGIEPDVVLGHSLGEFTALTFAGVFDFQTALGLVKQRAALMAAQGEAHPGGMVAVIGLAREILDEVTQEIPNRPELANWNAPDQIVLSGEKAAVMEAAERATARGAKKVLPLRVSAAFHSALMEEAARAFSDVLADTPFHPPRWPVVLNTTGKASEDAEEIRAALMLQMRSPVLFVDALREIARLGGEAFVEVGVGRVLSGLAKRTLEGIKTFTWAKPGDEEPLKELLGK